jgi:cell division protein WhiA
VAAMTPTVKDELSRLPTGKACCRRAEMAVILRFAGGLHLANGRVVVEAELDTASVARRLRQEIAEVFGHPSEIAMLAAGGLRRSARWLIRVDRGGEALARATGLIDQRGRPVRGLPPMIVTGGLCDAAAAWRGAFLAHGSLTEPGRSSSLEITSPGPEAALALVGAARRLGIQAKSKQVRGVDRVVIRDAEAIGAMLIHMGAQDSVLAWEERRMRREVRATANRLANFDDANLRRSARAAVAAGARVSAAMDILSGPSSNGAHGASGVNGLDGSALEAAPEHLLAAGELRLKHPQASLEELGALADPPMTKDAVAGRIRRLLALADKRAIALGLPTTEAAVSPELLEGA